MSLSGKNSFNISSCSLTKELNPGVSKIVNPLNSFFVAKTFTCSRNRSGIGFSDKSKNSSRVIFSDNASL